MGTLRQFINPLHGRTSRDYAGRMADSKAECMEVARQYGRDYWDGDRRFGYGGYRYDGRHKPMAQALIETYGLTGQSRILDVGCGKAHLLHELSLLLPGADIVGCDISEYALENAILRAGGKLFRHRVPDLLPFADGWFDLAVSVNTLHNLQVFEASLGLSELGRVARQGYVCVESYRSARELYNLECWALTCECFLSPEAWAWLFAGAGYAGDYEFIFFE